MAAISEVKSKEREMPFLESRTTMPSKKLAAEYIINIQTPVITNPIDPTRISKAPTNGLIKSSIVKAGLVFFSTVGAYYLAKTTNILSYFGLGAKNPNLKDVDSNEIMEVKNSLTIRANLGTVRQANSPFVNRITQTYKDKDRIVKFEEIKVEEFKNLPKVKKEGMLERRFFGRRSISVQNPISDQNVTVGKSFSLTIDGSRVFSSSSAVSLESKNIPAWLMLIPLNPNPTLKGSYDMLGAWKVVLSGNYAYVADRTGLQIIDISDPSNPTFKGSYNTPGHAHGVALSGNYAYVAAEHSGLQIVDITDPSNPTLKGSYNTPGRAYGVALSENYAYVADDYSGLQIIDVSDPGNPIFKSSYDTSGYFFEVALSGNYAYVANKNFGLQIIDVTNPSNPTFEGLYGTPGEAWGIAVSGSYAYVADGYSGLQIIDVTNPSNPTFEGSYDTPDRAYGVAIFGNYAYVADGGYDYLSGLQIIDISDPSNPTFKGSYNTLDLARGVALFGNYAYIACSDSVQIIALNAGKTDKLMFLGTSSSIGKYSVDIEGCNEEAECLSDSFDIIVGNGAPIIANPIQNQTAIINALFNYIFSTNAFVDPDGHSLTYTAKLSDDSPLPSWLNFNSPQRKFSGTPTTLTTYPIKVTANDNYEGVISTMFNLIVKDSLIIDDTDDTTDTTDMDDTTDTTDMTDLTATLIISSMTVVVCIACIASFCLPLIIGGGIVMFRRHRNKILGSEDNTKTKELKEVKELKKSETSDDKEIVVNEKLLQSIEE
jgi:hypothetical protein